MKKNNITVYLGMVVVPVMLALGFYSCTEPCIEGKGPVVRGTMEIRDFSKLKVNLTAEVFVSTGDEPSIRIEAQENVIEAISADVVGGTLILKSTPCVNTDEVFRIDLVVTELNTIILNGSGSIVTEDKLSAQEMELQVNGSGDMKIELAASSIEAGINGSGDIEINGSTEEFSLRINGSGDLKGLGLASESAGITISGSGNVWIAVSDRLSVDIAGSGNVRYRGNPKVDSDVKGSGEVSAAD